MRFPVSSGVYPTFKAYPTPPKYQVEQKFPFISLESEIDSLIAGCGQKTSILLQLLKETGMRIGEAAKLQWINVDSTRRVVTVNNPEKGSNPRMLKISLKLASMLSRLPKKNQYIFVSNNKVLENNFRRQRRRVAAKLENPRLLQIHFHTLRHWKGTTEYHKTKDPYHVKRLLGHKSLLNTEIYINIEQALFQTENSEFHVKVAEMLEKACKILEVGFEYVADMDRKKLFRKRK